MRYDAVSFSASYGTAQQLKPSDRPEIVFSGRSNVGKSSLLNKLFRRKNLARVSATPGKTITINFFDGDGVWFVDLPGYGYAQRSFSEKQRWSKLMEGYFRSGRNIALVVQLIDSRHKPSEQDFEMLEFLTQNEFRVFLALTKCDKLKPMERKRRETELEHELGAYNTIPHCFFSGETGEGLEQLKQAIEQIAADIDTDTNANGETV